MSEEQTAIDQMTADIRGMATRLAPERPVVTAFTNPERTRDGGVPVATIGAAAVAKRLESLIKRAGELTKQAEVLAVALAGPAKDAGSGIGVTAGRDHLFGKQMAALDELGSLLDSAGRAIERAQRSLT